MDRTFWRGLFLRVLAYYLSLILLMMGLLFLFPELEPYVPVGGLDQFQTATTMEISRNVAEAAHGSSEIAHNITQVAQAAHTTAEGAGNTQAAAHELARMSADLHRLVEEYERK